MLQNKHLGCHCDRRMCRGTSNTNQYLFLSESSCVVKVHTENYIGNVKCVKSLEYYLQNSDKQSQISLYRLT